MIIVIMHTKSMYSLINGFKKALLSKVLSNFMYRYVYLTNVGYMCLGFLSACPKNVCQFSNFWIDQGNLYSCKLC